MPAPRFDLARFGADVKAKVGADHGSYRKACARLPGINPGMLSRAVNGKPLRVESVLHLCASLGLNVWAYYEFGDGPYGLSYETAGFKLKPVADQPVTAPVSRETPAERHES